jgi:hypothetical protein
MTRCLRSFSSAFSFLVLCQFNFFLSEGFKDVLNDLKLFWIRFSFGQFIEAFHTTVDDFVESEYFVIGVDCLDTLLNNRHYFMTLSLDLFAKDTEPFARPNLKLRVDGFPKVNKSLKFVKLYVLKIF